MQPPLPHNHARYDGDGRRVEKSSGKLYWYDGGSEILAETDASGNTQNEYIFFGGQRIAVLPAGGNPSYYVEDLLGTSRVITTNTGAVCYDADFYPYGGERSYTNTCPQNYKFEGKERDTETGNDDFGARYYSNRFGRWLSADWSAVPAPVPYANLSNPQTLNLYAMVSDDPETFADLDGHQEPPPREEPERKEEDDKEDAEPEDIVERAEAEVGRRNAKEILDAHQAWVRAQTSGYEDPFTHVCYAPNPNAGGPTMRSANEGDTRQPEPEQKDSKSDSSDGRGGKQQRLQEIGNDDKASSADRGWIKQDQNAIKNGKRDSVRVPPGKQLAHARGREAAKGYSHTKSPSSLQNTKNHRTQHKYDANGAKNKERPN